MARRPGTVITSLTVLLAALALGACGGESREGDDHVTADGTGPMHQAGSGGELLSADDTARVVDAKRVLEAGCSGGGTAGYSMSREQAVGALLDVVRERGGTAVFEYGGSEAKGTMKAFLADEARRIRRCDPQSATRLQRAADAAPEAEAY